MIFDVQAPILGEIGLSPSGYRPDAAKPMIKWAIEVEGSQVRDILAGNLRRIRCEWGYSQTQLARLIGISAGYVCDIEKSRRWPSAAVMASIADVLHLDPFQLLLPTVDTPYFDRHRTLSAFNRLLQQRFTESAAEVVQDMIRPYGPMRKDVLERGALHNRDSEL